MSKPNRFRSEKSRKRAMRRRSNRIRFLELSPRSHSNKNASEHGVNVKQVVSQFTDGIPKIIKKVLGE